MLFSVFSRLVRAVGFGRADVCVGFKSSLVTPLRTLALGFVSLLITTVFASAQRSGPIRWGRALGALVLAMVIASAPALSWAAVSAACSAINNNQTDMANGSNPNFSGNFNAGDENYGPATPFAFTSINLLFATGDKINYSFTNPGGANVYIDLSTGGSQSIAAGSVNGVTSASGSGTITVPSTTVSGDNFSNGADVFDQFGNPNPAADNSIVNFHISCSPASASFGVNSLGTTHGPAAGGTSVVITGVGFTGTTGAGGVKFGATNATSYTVNSDTQITAVAPAGTANTTVDVVVTNNGSSTATVTGDHYTYDATTPTVTGVAPSVGALGGGNSVTITGTNFATVAATGGVKFGAATANYTINSATQITATVPEGAAGTVDVVVTNTAGASSVVAADHYTYEAAPTVNTINPNSGRLAGGTSITITGTNLVNGATTVTIGGNAATVGAVTGGGTSLTALIPSGTAGAQDVIVSTAGGSAVVTGGFTYLNAPTATAVSPNSGPLTGGTSVTLTGTNFVIGGTTVSVGGNAGTNVVVSSATSLTFTAPAGTGGTKTVSATTNGGAGNLFAGFTYLNAPAVTSFTATAVAYNASGAVFSVSGHANNSPTSYAVGSATTAQGGSVSVDSSGTVTYSAPTGFRGNDSFTYTATNGGGTSSPATVTVPISNPTLSASVTGTGAAQGTALSGYSITPSGGRATYSCNTTLTSGSLPAGVSLNANCTLSGTPGASGSFTFSDDITDSSTGTGPFTQTVTGLGFTVAAGPPTVTSISPTQGPGTGGTVVTITGTNFAGASAVNFGATAAAAFTVNSATSITVTAPAGTGTVDVRVTAPGGTSATGAADQFTNIPAPTITGVSPARGQAAGGATVTVSGTNLSTTTSIIFGGSAGNTLSCSSTACTIRVPAHAAGAVDVVVTTDGGTATLVGGYTYAAAVVVASTPSGTTTGKVGVSFSQTNVASGGNGSFTYALNAGAFTPGTTLNTATGTVSGTPTIASSFSYIVQATDTAGDPIGTSGVTTVNVAKGDQSITLNNPGSHRLDQGPLSISASVNSGLTLSFGSTTTGVCTVSGNAITLLTTGNCTITADQAGDGNWNAATQQSQTFAVTAPLPTVSSISPTAGPATGGTVVTLTGTGFSGATAVSFGATAASSFTVNSATQITATAPAGTGTVDIRVTTVGGTSATSASDQYTYVAAPTVSSISPNAGPTTGGTVVTLSGTNFSGATAVNFGATAATAFTVNSATSITATAPAGAGTVDVRVTTTGGTSASSASDHYTYVVAPTVSSIAPTAGPTTGGTSVTLTGTNFSGTTQVTFGATFAAFTLNSSTSITATAPAGTGTVDVRVTTAGGTSATTASDQYTYAAAPTVSAISPTAGPTTGGTVVTLTGTNFSGATAVNFGATAATAFTVNSATQITATAPAGAGTVDVRVTAVGGTSATTASDHYTYVAGPVVTGLSPTAGPTTGGTVVTLSGANFTGATAVSFGGTAASSFTVNAATQITATAPAGAGTVDIRVTTTGGTSAATASDRYTYVAPPVVNALSPAAGPTTGGTAVTLTGTDFTSVSAVRFGPTAASSFTVNSATSITATAPAGTGAVDVSVTAIGGTSAPTLGDLFTYQAPVLGVAMTHSGNATKGGTVSYTITPSGTVSPTVGALTATFSFPAGVAYNAASGAGWTCSATSCVSTTVIAAGASGNPITLVANIGAGAAASVSPGVTLSGGSAAAAATATDATTVIAAAAPTASITVSPSQIAIGGTAHAVITLTNPNGSAALSSLADTSIFQGGVQLAASPNLVTTCGGALSPTTGAGGRISLAGGVLAAGATCTVSFDVTTNAAAGFNIQSGTPSASESGSGAAGNSAPLSTPRAATASVAANPSTIVVGGTSVLTFTLTSDNGVAVINNLGDSLTLPTGVTVAASPATSTTCGGTVTAAAGGSSVALSGGALGANGTCTFKVTVAGTGAGTPSIPSGTPTGDLTSGAVAGTSAILTVNLALPTVSSVAPNAGPLAGGASVTLTGANFTNTSAVKFGAANAASFTLNSPTSITATAPAGSAGAVDVTVTNPSGTSATGSNDRYTYTAAPVAGAVSVTVDQDTTNDPIALTLSGGTAASVAVGTAPAHGSVTVSGTALTYTPTAGYSGADSFTYTASNAGGTSSAATVSVTVRPTAPTAAAKTVAVTAQGGANGAGPQPVQIDLSASVTNASSIILSTAPSHGTATVNGFVVTYTPTPGYFGTDSFAYEAVQANGSALLIIKGNDGQPVVFGAGAGVGVGGATTSAPATVSITIVNPTLSLSPATLPAAQSGVAYSQQISAGGGTAPYTYVLTGSLPDGLSFNAATATISGTPTAAATANVSIKATDSSTGTGPFSVTQAYTFTVNLGAPTATAKTMTELAGQPVVIHAAEGATGGPFTGVTILTRPTVGTIVTSGADITFTAPANFSGRVTFTYTLNNATGASPVTTATITVNPMPFTPAPIVVQVAADKSAQADVTTTASGGPFTSATIASATPSSGGTVQLVQTGGTAGVNATFAIKFTAATHFSGPVVVSYTLSNAFATSAPGTVTFQVAARADPTQDPDVRGLIQAQADTAIRFAEAQMTNFNQRLESLHSERGAGSHNGITAQIGDGPEQPDPDQSPARTGDLAFLPKYFGARGLLDGGLGRTSALNNRAGAGAMGLHGARAIGDSLASGGGSGGGGDKPAPADDRWAFWTGGSIDFGMRHEGATRSGLRFNTAGLSVGTDYRYSERLVVGVGFGYGQDKTNVGNDGTQDKAHSEMGVAYASFHPAGHAFIDALVGYGQLHYDTRRFYAAAPELEYGKRTGDELFGSLTAAWEYRTQRSLLAPYGRIDAISGTLDAFTEQGGVGALAFAEQDVKSFKSTLGLRGEYLIVTAGGTWQPRFRIEYQHEFQGAGSFSLQYADWLSGPTYLGHLDPARRDQLVLGVGTDYRRKGLTFSFDIKSNPIDQGNTDTLVTAKAAWRF